jgi:hypothetical protein
MKAKVNLLNDKLIHFAEHEILLSFHNDSGAEAFYEWWQAGGEAEFAKWCRYNLYDNEVEKEKI